MKTIISALCCVTICSTLSACESKDDKRETAPVEVPNVSNATQFEATKKIAQAGEPGFDSYQEQRFGKSCDVVRDSQGKIESFEPRPKFDSKLKDGETVYIFTTQNLQEGTIQMQRRLTVKEVSEQKAVNEVSLVSISYLHLGEILTRPLVQTQECGMVAEMGSFDCSNQEQDQGLESMKENLTEVGYTYLQRHPDLDLSECSIPQAHTESSQVEEGTYQMSDGRKLPAYQETFEKAGLIVCQGREVGEGVMSEKVISSLEQKAFPSDFMEGSSCGGVVLFKSSVTKLGGSSGKTVTSTRYEIKPQINEVIKAPEPAPKPLAQK